MSTSTSLKDERMSDPRFIECPRCDGGETEYGRCDSCYGNNRLEIEDDAVEEWEMWPEERE